MTAHKTLAAALVAAQAEMPAPGKDANNPHFHTAFVSLDNLIAKTRPVLNAHGLAVAQFPAVGELGQPVLRTVIVHAESAETLGADAPLFLPKQDMQGLGSAVTYARRYAWAAALGIASEEDDDGENASRPRSPETPAKEKNAWDDGKFPPPDALHARLLELAAEWKTLTPEWDEAELTQWLDANGGNPDLVAKAVAKYEANVAVKRAEVEAAGRFPIPAGAKKAAA